ncbi:hypothetical protein CPB83DRAFT_843278 [Crepidotus variabilis]|uniref:Sodium/calcium exchanger membrane region domain-containing protein n=1 Tax=Crepidotus variabilis TaxID=179855 RepID=A0A9P6ETI3_9AGAR|nr:hypothetical protein CPB83DRAFT_843278 [Crepidotus variabilis]
MHPADGPKPSTSSYNVRSPSIVSTTPIGSARPRKPHTRAPTSDSFDLSRERQNSRKWSDDSESTIAASLDELEANKAPPERFLDRWNRRGKKAIGLKESLYAIAFSSWLNMFFVFIPLSWMAHFEEASGDSSLKWGAKVSFCLCFCAILPLARLFHYGGEQMAIYLGKDMGDLVIVTLNNAVEATLAILLLVKCDLVLLKSTIIGVVILRLLLVPGTAFVIGGSRIIQQDLHPTLSQLNQSILTLGVLALALPAATFAAMDTPFSPVPGQLPVSAVSDETRDSLLSLSRGLAIILLIMYICSRIYLHNPPGEDDLTLGLHLAANAPEELKHKVEHLRQKEPEVNQYILIVMLLACLALMATTCEWLIHSVEHIREATNISEVFFGLILLPVVSYAADGTVAIVYYVRHYLKRIFNEPEPPATLAHSEAIEMSIQFVLFWMPFLILLAWWTGKPLTMLFDLFHVVLILGACFLVNYVTADAKTNWAEGMAMVTLYAMIVLCAWFYQGQPELNFMSQCTSVKQALANFNNVTNPLHGSLRYGVAGIPLE